MRVKLEAPLLSEFFQNIKQNPDFSNWKEFCRKIKSRSPSTIKEIRLGNRTFSAELFEEFLEFIKQGTHKLFAYAEFPEMKRYL